MKAFSLATTASLARRKWVWIALALIVLLAAFLRFYHLGAQGYGNSYYAATVKSMLTSWHNFFFASFEPGGSVTVDKPPLGFWMQCLSALIFGVNGFALALPQALAGVGSVLLLFFLLRKPFGDLPALLGALVLAVTPVAISAERNNTIDGQLTFVLMLAAWALLRSIASGRLRWLLLAAFLIGIGFNIKMLQAYMVLPGFYLVFLLTSRHSLLKRTLHLAAATILLLSVSFAWVITVDLTPAENRPYIGSSENNTVIELVFGHNAAERFSLGTGAGQPNFSQANEQPSRPQNPPNFQPQQENRPGGSNEVGNPGALRLFSTPLINEIGWALPLALAGMLLAGLVARRKVLDSQPGIAVLLWSGWLIPCLAFFSITSGIFHAYYVIMIAAPIAALIAAGAWALQHLGERSPNLACGLAAAAAVTLLAYQAANLQAWPRYLNWILAAAALFLGLGLFWAQRKHPAAIYPFLLAALVTPAFWSALTTFNTNSNNMLPRSGPAATDSSQRFAQPPGPRGSAQVMNYILENAPAQGYLLATVSANEAAPFILATGRPVLTFGGFSGNDPIVDVKELSSLVANKQLTLVLYPPNKRDEIAAWLKQNCHAQNLPENSNQPRQNPAPGLITQNATILYNCSQ